MSFHFLLPANPVRSGVVDEMFADQYEAFLEAGFSVSLLPDSVIQHRKALRDIQAGSTVVYRGWMLNAGEYGRLIEAIEGAGGTPLTSLDSYLAAHHLPRWYPLISDLTPETRVTSTDEDLEKVWRELGWGAAFLKDYVKSIKTALGSIITDPAQISGLVREMERIRGEVEGGLCLRRVEEWDVASEVRYFVVRGKAFGPGARSDMPEIVEQVALRIKLPFYSVDVVRRGDGVLRVVEVGDGQVSDLVGWSATDFVAMWRT